MRKNSIKNTRINGEVRRVLSSIIQNEIKDPRIHPMTSVVEVEVAPDLKSAKAYISVLGDEEAQKNTFAFVFNSDRPACIRFIKDQSIEYGVHMSKLIDDVNQTSVEEEGDEDDQACE